MYLSLPFVLGFCRVLKETLGLLVTQAWRGMMVLKVSLEIKGILGSLGPLGNRVLKVTLGWLDQMDCKAILVKKGTCFWFC